MILGKRNSFHWHSFFCKHSFGSTLHVYFFFSRLFILTLSKRLLYVFLIQLIHLWISAQLVIDGLPAFLTDAPVVPFRRICQFVFLVFLSFSSSLWEGVVSYPPRSTTFLKKRCRSTEIGQGLKSELNLMFCLFVLTLFEAKHRRALDWCVPRFHKPENIILSTSS